MDNKLVNWIHKDRRSMEKIEYDRLVCRLSFEDPDSDEYKELLQRISTLNNLEKSNKKDIPWGAIIGLVGTGIACATSVMQMKTVCKYEDDGFIPNSKWFGKIPLPKVF